MRAFDGGRNPVGSVAYDAAVAIVLFEVRLSLGRGNTNKADLTRVVEPIKME